MEVKNIKKTYKFSLECEYEREDIVAALDFLKQLKPYETVLEDLVEALEEIIPDFNSEDDEE